MSNLVTDYITNMLGLCIANLLIANNYLNHNQNKLL